MSIAAPASALCVSIMSFGKPRASHISTASPPTSSRPPSLHNRTATLPFASPRSTAPSDLCCRPPPFPTQSAQHRSNTGVTVADARHLITPLPRTAIGGNYSGVSGSTHDALATPHRLRSGRSTSESRLLLRSSRLFSRPPTSEVADATRRSAAHTAAQTVESESRAGAAPSTPPTFCSASMSPRNQLTLLASTPYVRLSSRGLSATHSTLPTLSSQPRPVSVVEAAIARSDTVIASVVHLPPAPPAAATSHTALHSLSKQLQPPSRSPPLATSSASRAASASVSSLASPELTFHELTDDSSDSEGSDNERSEGSVDERVRAGSSRGGGGSVRRVSLLARSQRSLTPILTQRTPHVAACLSLDDTIASTASPSSSVTLSLSAVSKSPTSDGTVGNTYSPLPSPSPQPLAPAHSGGPDQPTAIRRPLGLINLGNTVSPTLHTTHTPLRPLTQSTASASCCHVADVSACPPACCAGWLVQCYLNAALQCLLSVPRLLAHFTDPSLHSWVGEVRAGAARSSGELAKCFAALCSQLAASPSSPMHSVGGSVSPAALLRCFTALDASFSSGEQHDSHELVRCLLSRLHDDVNTVTHQPPYEQLEERAGESDWQQSERWW